VESVGELDEHDPDVVRHREEHLSDVLGLLLLVAEGAELAELRDPVDEVGDLAAEAILDVRQVVLGVLGDIVQDRRLNGDRIDPEVGQDLGGRDRMGDVRLSGGAPLVAVGLDREIDGGLKGREIRPGGRGAGACR